MSDTCSFDLQDGFLVPPLAAKFRSHFVAAIPIAGTLGEIALDTLRDLPLYVIHSEADRRVPIEETAKAVERLQAMRPPLSLPDCPAGITLSTTWSLPHCAPRCVPGSRPCGSTREVASSHPHRWAAHGAWRAERRRAVIAIESREMLGEIVKVR